MTGPLSLSSGWVLSTVRCAVWANCWILDLESSFSYLMLSLIIFICTCFIFFTYHFYCALMSSFLLWLSTASASVTSGVALSVSPIQGAPRQIPTAKRSCWTHPLFRRFPDALVDCRRCPESQPAGPTPDTPPGRQQISAPVTHRSCPRAAEQKHFARISCAWGPGDPCNGEWAPVQEKPKNIYGGLKPQG